MEHHSHEFYCDTICPLLETSNMEVPWRCLVDCQYDEDHVLLPPPRQPLYRRQIPHYVKRDPREFYNSHPISLWMYGDHEPPAH